MGVTSDFAPVENPNPQHGATALEDTVADPEISASTVLDTTMYVRLLMPPERGPATVETTRGEVIFETIGCATCHVPMMTTGDSPIAELSDVDAYLYSDMLLHDMGEELADHRPDGDATGMEWKTAPLWGTRLVADFTNGVAHYMHDGRSTDLTEATEAHFRYGREEGVTDEITSVPKRIDLFTITSVSDRVRVVSEIEFEEGSEEGTRLPAGEGTIEDNNTTPSVVGRVAYSPSPSVEVGASGHCGSYNTSAIEGLDVDERRNLALYVLDFEANVGPATLRGEFATANVDLPAGFVDIFAENEQGYYGEVVLPFAIAAKPAPCLTPASR
jgi:hypothetical protein